MIKSIIAIGMFLQTYGTYTPTYQNDRTNREATMYVYACDEGLRACFKPVIPE